MQKTREKNAKKQGRWFALLESARSASLFRSALGSRSACTFSLRRFIVARCFLSFLICLLLLLGMEPDAPTPPHVDIQVRFHRFKSLRERESEGGRKREETSGEGEREERTMRSEGTSSRRPLPLFFGLRPPSSSAVLLLRVPSLRCAPRLSGFAPDRPTNTTINPPHLKNQNQQQRNNHRPSRPASPPGQPAPPASPSPRTSSAAPRRRPRL